MIQQTIATPNSGDRDVIFAFKEGEKSFADGDGIYDGVCEVCHTQTRFHRNDGSGEAHFAGADCMECHPHADEFAGLHEGEEFIGNCPICHSQGIIAGSPHDFSAQPWSGGDLCAVCHSDDTSWSHELTSAIFNLYNSSTIDAVDIGQPEGDSRYCLSCHDGTVAIDSFGGSTGWYYMWGPAYIGTDLSGKHPISFTYDTNLAAIDPKLSDPLFTPSGLGGSIAEDMLSFNKLECSSCHNVHNEDWNNYMLKKPNGGSDLCYTCHNNGLMGTAHDFSFQGWSMGEICVVCHAAKNIWNHELTTTIFNLYSSPTLDADDLDQPDGTTRYCLSCHDGTVPIDSFEGNWGWNFMWGGPFMDWDLSDDHPMSFTYDNDLVIADGKLYDPITTPSMLGGTIADDMLNDGIMECASCHDLHNIWWINPLLKKFEIELCFTCHIEPEIMVGAHTDYWCTGCHFHGGY
jgi:predicted CXXCH cytochrome family protein